MKILLIGESCQDIYHYGEVNRISPEAPVPILDFERKEIKDGMSLNVKNNLESLFKCEVDHITQKTSIEKHRFIDKKTGQQLLRCDFEDNIDKCQINAQPYQKLGENILKSYDCIVISDYNKGFISANHMHELCDLANCPVFIDTKKNVFELDQKNVFVKVNKKEYDELSVSTKERFNNNLIVTLGEKGCRFDNVIYPGYSVDVFDVCGAGDVFLAAFTYAYMTVVTIGLRKTSAAFLENVFAYANRKAAESVKHRGTYVVSRK